MEKRSKKIMFVAVIAAIIVAVPISFYTLSSYQPPISVHNDCYVSYVNYSKDPYSTLEPIEVRTLYLTSSINETNHGTSSLTMNISSWLVDSGVDNKMIVHSNISFCGNISSSLHPTRMELKITGCLVNGIIGISIDDLPLPYAYNGHSSNVSLEGSYYNRSGRCNYDVFSLHNSSLFSFFGNHSPFFHFKYSQEIVQICYAPPFNQTHILTFTLSLLGLQKPVYVEYRMAVTKT